MPACQTLANVQSGVLLEHSCSLRAVLNVLTRFRASDKCQREKRKTINGDDLLWAMGTLGFEEYVEPLNLYLHKYREVIDTLLLGLHGVAYAVRRTCHGCDELSLKPQERCCWCCTGRESFPCEAGCKWRPEEGTARLISRGGGFQLDVGSVVETSHLSKPVKVPGAPQDIYCLGHKAPCRAGASMTPGGLASPLI